MTESSGLHVVLGASGGTGRALVAELLRRGRAVRAVARRAVPGLPPDVEQVPADLADADAARRAVSGAAVVYHAAQPAYHRWPQEFPHLTASIRRAVASAGARLAVMDNLYMYGPHDGPITEDLPYAATGRNGRVRAAMAKTLLRAHASGELPVVLGRASNYYGPHGLNTVAGERVFGAALAGKKVQLLGRLDQPHTWSYLPDVARALVNLAETPDAYGAAWHLPAAVPITQREFVDLIFRFAGTPPRYGTLSRPVITLVGLVNPVVRQLPETLYEFERPYLLDASAYRSRIAGFDAVPHEQAVRDTVEWFRSRRT